MLIIAILLSILVFSVNFKIKLIEYFIVKYDISDAVIQQFTEGSRFSMWLNPKLYKDIAKDRQRQRLFILSFLFVLLIFFIYVHISSIGDYLGSAWALLFYSAATGVIIYLIYPAFTIRSRLIKCQNLAGVQ